MPIPPPPPSCTGFVPGCGENPIPETSMNLGQDIYDDNALVQESELQLNEEYDVVQDVYSGPENAYYNITLKKNFFTNNSKTQYLTLVLRNETVEQDGD